MYYTISNAFILFLLARNRPYWEQWYESEAVRDTYRVFCGICCEKLYINIFTAQVVWSFFLSTEISWKDIFNVSSADKKNKQTKKKHLNYSTTH